MRRSNSTSHIPLRARSRSLLRSGGKDVPSGDKPSRPGSMDRLRIPTTNAKRSIPTSNAKKSTTFLGLKKLTFNTPQMRSSQSSLKRSNSTTSLVTPLSATRNRSPFKANVNDKKWVLDQHAKVSRYLHENYLSQEQTVDLKPPTLTTFAFVMNLLLKEIDPRVEVNSTNYKDVVFNILKVLRYPGALSISLLKTANTMHAWPQIMSILSWIVELVKVIKRAKEPDRFETDIKYQKSKCVSDYLILKYFLYNDGEDTTSADEEFKQRFSTILNIDEIEIEDLRSTVQELGKIKEKRSQELEENQYKIEKVEKEIKEKCLEIDTYYKESELKHKEIDEQIVLLKDKRLQLLENMNKKKNNIVNLRGIIKKQQCTIEDKKKILIKIDEFKHTIDLMKERMLAKQAIQASYDQKLAEAKKTVESNVFRLNNSLLKLLVLKPELKKLHLKNSDYASEEFGDNIKSLIANLKIFENEINKEIEWARISLVNVKAQNEKLQQCIDTARHELLELKDNKAEIKELIERCESDLQLKQNQREWNKVEFEEKMNKLTNDDINLDDLLQELSDSRKENISKYEEFQDIKEQTVVFFIKLREKSIRNIAEMVEIHDSIQDTMQKSLEEIYHVEAEIAHDMHVLDKISQDKVDKL